MRQHFFINNQFATKIFAEQGFGNIICRWSKAPCYNNNIRLCSFFIKSIPDIIIYITYGNTTANPYTNFIQLLCNESRVGINGLAYQ